MSGDVKSQLVLFIIVAIIGAGFLVADVVILIRWILYYYARSQAVSLVNSNFDLPTSGVVAQPPMPEPQDSLSPEMQERIQRAADTEMEDIAGMPRRPFARTWSLTDPFIAIQIVLIVGNILAAIPLLPLIFKQGQEAIYSPAGILIQVIATILLNVLFVAVVAFYVHRYGTTLKEIGLRAPTPQQIGLGIGAGLLLAALAQGGELGMGFALPYLLPKSVLNGLIKFTQEVTAGGMFEKIPSLNLKIFFALAGVVAAPIGEEVFFRGFLYNALKRRLNVTAAIVISGLLFGLIHLGPLAIVIIFPMGMALAYVYEKTGSLWITILMHGVNNGLAFAVSLLFPHLGEDATNRQHTYVPPPVRHAAYRTVPMSVFEGNENPTLKHRAASIEDRKPGVSLSGGRV